MKPLEGEKEHLFWQMPRSQSSQQLSQSESHCPSTIPIFNFYRKCFSTLTTTSETYWGGLCFGLALNSQQVSFSFQPVSMGDDGYLPWFEFDDLTVLPQDAEKQHVTAIVGQNWETSTMKLVFLAGGRVEMKDLNFTFLQLLRKFESWRQMEENKIS